LAESRQFPLGVFERDLAATLGCLFDGQELWRALQIIIQFRLDFLSVCIQFAQRLLVQQSKLFLSLMVSLQNQGLSIIRELPASLLLKTGAAILIRHARDESVVREQVHLIANPRAISARQSSDKTRGQA